VVVVVVAVVVVVIVVVVAVVAVVEAVVVIVVVVVAVAVVEVVVAVVVVVVVVVVVIKVAVGVVVVVVVVVVVALFVLKFLLSILGEIGPGQGTEISTFLGHVFSAHSADPSAYSDPTSPLDHAKMPMKKGEDGEQIPMAQEAFTNIVDFMVWGEYIHTTILRTGSRHGA